MAENNIEKDDLPNIDNHIKPFVSTEWDDYNTKTHEEKIIFFEREKTNEMNFKLDLFAKFEKKLNNYVEVEKTKHEEKDKIIKEKVNDAKANLSKEILLCTKILDSVYDVCCIKFNNFVHLLFFDYLLSHYIG
jgi:hypothetical protein